MAAELGEAANGGQVLLSHDAWLRLQDRMHEASFPVVEQLGSYKLNAWPVPMPVYQARLLYHLAAGVTAHHAELAVLRGRVPELQSSGRDGPGVSGLNSQASAVSGKACQAWSAEQAYGEIVGR